MYKLSVVIITLNEERNIERCLRSLLNVADEIVVVDSFSSDNTKSICEKHKTKFVQIKWMGYSDTKNYANSIAENDWILSLDADESLSEDLQKGIADFKKNGFSGAYRFNRRTNYCGKWIRNGGWYPDKKIRLFNRNEARWTGGFVHEELTIDQNVSVQEWNADILHYSYYSIQEHVSRSEKYARLGAEKISRSGKKNYLKMIFSPAMRFFKMFFIQRGFLDGYHGFKIASITSREVFLKYKWANDILRK